MRTVRILTLLIAAVAAANVNAAECSGTAYARALCLFTSGDYAHAESEFRALAISDDKNPEVLKSRYFLARSEMKQKKWADAEKELISIFTLDASFYREWSCDYLLGECRDAVGKE